MKLAIRAFIVLPLFFAAAFSNCHAAGGAAPLKRLDFVDSSAIDVVRAIAEICDYDVVVGYDPGNRLSRKVTLQMRDVRGVDAIDRVLRIAGLRFVKEGNSIMISTLPADMSGSAFCKEGIALFLRHITAERAIAVLSRTYPEVAASAGPSSNMVVVKGAPDDLERARKLTAGIDVAPAQVLIEGKVIEISESGMEDIGAKWGREVGKFRLAVDRDTGDIGLTEDILLLLSDLVGKGKAEVLAEPSLMAMDGSEAVINIGSRVPYAVPASTSSTSTQWAVDYIDAGVSMRIIPRVLAGGALELSFKPEVSSISEWRATSAGEFPVITTRNAETRVNVADGETIVIGGLVNRTERENTSGLALLGDIPLFGALFQNRVRERTRTEIVFVLTPRIAAR